MNGLIHGLNNTYLYTAKKVVATWVDGQRTAESQGTGFFILKGNKEIVFVTNRHVIDPEYADPKYKGYKFYNLRIETFTASNSVGWPLELSSATIAKTKIGFDVNPHNDVACLMDMLVNDALVASFHIPYDMLATEEWIDTKLSVCDQIAYPGFPMWFDHKKNAPIFRMGTIASDPRGDYSFQENEPEAARIAYEGFSSCGASGSPVFAVQKGFKVSGAIEAPEDFFRPVKLVGINAGHYTDEKERHSGISFFYKSSVIKRIIDNMLGASPPSS